MVENSLCTLRATLLLKKKYNSIKKKGKCCAMIKVLQVICIVCIISIVGSLYSNLKQIDL